MLGLALVVGAGAAWLAAGSPSGAHDDHPPALGTEGEHIHAAVPPGYAAQDTRS